MSTLTARHIFKRVRGIINRIPVVATKTSGLDDELPWRVQNTTSNASGTISDEVLLYHLNFVNRYIVSSCKVFHLGTNVETSDAITGPSLSDDEIKGRIVHGTIKRNNASGTPIRTRYRELGEHHDMESSGREASEVYPAYIYLDNDVVIHPTPTNGSEAKYVVSPSSISIENMVDSSDVLAVDHRFEGVYVSYVAYRAFMQLDMIEHAQAWRQLFNRQIEPFLIGTRIGDNRKNLISAIEYEKENEIE